MVLNVQNLSAVTVNGNGQVFSHVASLALAATHMHPVLIPATSPTMPFNYTWMHAPPLPCLQAAAFTSSLVATFVVMNRCNFAVGTFLDFGSAAGTATATTFI